MAGQTVRLIGPDQRALATRLIASAPDGAVVNIKEATRSLDQNSLMWVLLSDVSRSKPEGRALRSEQWKAAFMSALGHEVRWINGVDGHPPFPDQHSTSRLNKSDMADLITFIMEYGDRHGVVWSEQPERKAT